MSPRKIILRPPVVGFVALFTLIVGSGLVNAAETIPDGSTNTVMDAALNGVPVVNIASPNSDGVSRNTYSDFNVESQGLILNNANDFGVSQLGGAMTPNPHLNGGTGANVILNEVTTTNLSNLNGYTETFGQRAEFVLANPNGITCDGCGFINTSRARLITGHENTPQGTLGTFTLGPGQVNIEGAGLNGENVDAIDIISQAVSIQGQLRANQQLSVKTGNDQYNAANNQVTSNSNNSGNTFSIDAGLLGSMYAGKIELVTTEAGVGVRSAADIIAQDSVTINSSGDTDTALIQAGNQLTINTADTLTQQGDYLAGQLIDLSGNTLTLNHRIESDQNITLEQRSGDLLLNAALNGGTGKTTLTNNNGILTIANTLFSAGDITLNANHIDNQNKIAAQGNLTLNSQTDIANNTGNLLFSGLNLSLNADGSFNNSGDLYSKGTLTAKGLNNTAMAGLINRGRIESLGDITINSIVVENTYANDATVQTPTGTVNGIDNWIEEVNPALVRGLLQSSGAVTINADTVKNDIADMYAGGELTINANHVENTAYVLKEGVTESYQNLEVVGKKCRFGRWNCKNIYGYVTRYRELIQDTPNSIKAGIQTNGALTINTPTDGLIDNGVISTGISSPTGGLPDATISDPMVGITLPGESGLFMPNPAPDAEHPYIIETDPALIDLGKLYGSPYFLERIGYAYDGDTLLFLGDAYFDQRAISDQVRLLTGQRYLISEADDNLQYLQLADQAALERERLGLELGKLLTDEQIASLENNIIWYVETEVDGKKVLAPRLYLSQATRNTVAEGKHALLKGEQVALSTGNLMNEGLILSDAALSITTGENLHNKGGTLKAKEAINIAAGGDLISETTWWESIAGDTIRNGIHSTAEIIAGGDVNVNSQHDIQLIAANINSEGNVNFNAEGDVSIEAVELTNKYNWTENGWNYSDTTVSHSASSINANQFNSIGNGDIFIEGASITTQGDINLLSAGAINILALVNSHELTGEHKKIGGWFSADKTSTITQRQQTLQTASLNSGANLKTLSGANTLILASNLTSTGDLHIDSHSGDILIIAGKNSEYTRNTHSSKGIIYKKSSDVGSYKESLVAANITSGGHLFVNTLSPDESTDAYKGNVVVTGSNVRSAGDMQFGGVTLSNDNAEGAGRFVLAETDMARIENLTFDTLALQDNDWSYYTKKLTGFGKVLGVTKAILTFDSVVLEMTDIVDTKATYQKGTNVSAGNDFSVYARDGITFIGASVKGAGKGTLDAGGNVNILASVDQKVKKEEHVKATIDGFSFNWDGKRASVGVDGHYRKTSLNETTLSHRASQLEFGGDLTVHADRDVNIAASNLLANGQLSVEAKQALSIYSVDDILSMAESVTEAKLRISIGVGNAYYDVKLAVDQYKEAKKQRKAAEKALDQFDDEIKQMQSDLEKGLVTEDDIRQRRKDRKYYVANVAFARVNEINAAVQVGAAGARAAAAAASSYGTGFYVDVKFELNGSKTKRDKYETTSIASSLTSVGDMNLVSGDVFRLHGSDIATQGNLTIAAAKDITIEAAENRQTLGENTKGINIAVGIGTYGVDAGSGSASLGLRKGQSDSETIINRASTIVSGGNISVTGGDNINVVGSDVKAQGDISLSAVNDILIEAARDTRNSHSENQSLSLSLSYKTQNNNSAKSNPNNTKKADSKSKGGVGDTKWGSSVGYGRGYDNYNSVTWRNSSVISGGTLKTKSGEDTTLAGANVLATDVVATVGGDLLVQSRQNTVYARGETFGINVGTSSSGLNGGKRSQDRRWVDNMTTLVGLNSITIDAQGKTDLVGALIAQIDAEGKDGGNLSITTNEFIYKDLVDYDRASNWSAGFSSTLLGLNNFKSESKKSSDESTKDDSVLIRTDYDRNGNVWKVERIPAESGSTDQNVGSGDNKKNKPFTGNTSLQLATSGHVKGQITHATLGNGTINQRIEQSDSLVSLNRDINKLQTVTANRKTGGLNINARVDHRMLTVKGWNNILQENKDTAKKIYKAYSKLKNNLKSDAQVEKEAQKDMDEIAAEGDDEGDWRGERLEQFNDQSKKERDSQIVKWREERGMSIDLEALRRQREKERQNEEYENLFGEYRSDVGDIYDSSEQGVVKLIRVSNGNGVTNNPRNQNAKNALLKYGESYHLTNEYGETVVSFFGSGNPQYILSMLELYADEKRFSTNSAREVVTYFQKNDSKVKVWVNDSVKCAYCVSYDASSNTYIIKVNPTTVQQEKFYDENNVKRSMSVRRALAEGLGYAYYHHSSDGRMDPTELKIKTFEFGDAVINDFENDNFETKFRNEKDDKNYFLDPKKKNTARPENNITGNNLLVVNYEAASNDKEYYGGMKFNKKTNIYKNIDQKRGEPVETEVKYKGVVVAKVVSYNNGLNDDKDDLIDREFARQDILDMFGTTQGKKMAETLLARAKSGKSPLKINVNHVGDNSASDSDYEINFDASNRSLVLNKKGELMRADTMQTLAHDMGHKVLGTKEWSKQYGYMNNVEINENPILAELGYSENELRGCYFCTLRDTKTYTVMHKGYRVVFDSKSKKILYYQKPDGSTVNKMNIHFEMDDGELKTVVPKTEPLPTEIQNMPNKSFPEYEYRGKKGKLKYVDGRHGDIQYSENQKRDGLSKGTVFNYKNNTKIEWEEVKVNDFKIVSTVVDKKDTGFVVNDPPITLQPCFPNRRRGPCTTPSPNVAYDMFSYETTRYTIMQGYKVKATTSDIDSYDKSTYQQIPGSDIKYKPVGGYDLKRNYMFGLPSPVTRNTYNNFGICSSSWPKNDRTGCKYSP